MTVRFVCGVWVFWYPRLFQAAGLGTTGWEDDFEGVALDQRAVFEGAQGFVGAGDDFIAFGEAGEHLNIGCAGDAGGDGNELCAELAGLVFIEDKDALNGGALGGRG